MARIIRPSPKKEPVSIGCQRCLALVEFEFEDMQYQSDQRDGDYYTAACPACGRPIYIDVTRTGWTR